MKSKLAVLGFILALATVLLAYPSGVLSDTVKFMEHNATKEQKVTLQGGIALEMVWCPPGSFTMGTYRSDKDALYGEHPRHKVTLTQGFWIGKYEVTKEQWKAVMGTAPWLGRSSVLDEADSPAVCVSWNDARDFIAALSSQTNLTFRLPTEAEWEYACRAGTNSSFFWGDDPEYRRVADYAWCWDNCQNERYAHLVGQKPPNDFGLYDMSGNVWEWVQDWWVDYTSASAAVDPKGPPDGRDRVFRGGGWRDLGVYCRSAYFGSASPVVSNSYIGFRLCR